jgi:hypothetical protein
MLYFEQKACENIVIFSHAFCLLLLFYPVVQAAPLREKLVGTGLVLLNEPLKPIPVDVPAASELFHDKLVAVTC